MRIGSRRNVWAIVLPGETGADEALADRLLHERCAELAVSAAALDRGGLVRRAHRLRPLREPGHAVPLTHDLAPATARPVADR